MNWERTGATRLFHGAMAAFWVAQIAAALNWPALRDTALGAALDAAYVLSCHQMPDRCFRIGGVTMPVCARCFGFWIGFCLASILVLRRPGQMRARWRVAVVLVAAGAADWALAPLLLPGSNLERLLAGVVGGAGLYLVLTRLSWTGIRVAARCRRTCAQVLTRMASASQQ